MEFREWFCLKDRESFTIDPKIYPGDARFYFGRSKIEKALKAQLRRSFVAPGVPKMIIYGSYGSGKTQTLFHLEHYLQTDKPPACKLNPRTIHLDLEMHSKSTHYDWHLQLLEKVGKEDVTQWIDSLRDRGVSLDSELAGIFGDPNLVNAARTLILGGDPAFLAWRWLCGQKLSPKELEQLKVTRNLGQTGVGDLVNALLGIGKLAAANGEVLIFLMDEAEQFINVRTGDATQFLHLYLRKLAEPSNSVVGFIIASWGTTLDDTAELLRRADVRSRLGEHNYVEIPPLPAIEDIRTFVREMLAELVDGEKAEAKIQREGLGITLETYPFNSDSFDLLCEYASQDPVKALPRNLINAINECAISAWDGEKPIIDEDIVNDVAPLIFG
jgi:DNA polymerase III delta prime subunit